MKTERDYTNLAQAYLQRPDYAPSAIAEVLARAGVKPGDEVCDVGAGAPYTTRVWMRRKSAEPCLC